MNNEAEILPHFDFEEMIRTASYQELYDLVTAMEPNEHPDRYQRIKQEIQARESQMAETDIQEFRRRDMRSGVKGMFWMALILGVLHLMAGGGTFSAIPDDQTLLEEGFAETEYEAIKGSFGAMAAALLGLGAITTIFSLYALAHLMAAGRSKSTGFTIFYISMLVIGSILAAWGGLNVSGQVLEIPGLNEPLREQIREAGELAVRSSAAANLDELEEIRTAAEQLRQSEIRQSGMIFIIIGLAMQVPWLMYLFARLTGSKRLPPLIGYLAAIPMALIIVVYVIRFFVLGQVSGSLGGITVVWSLIAMVLSAATAIAMISSRAIRYFRERDLLHMPAYNKMLDGDPESWSKAS